MKSEKLYSATTKTGYTIFHNIPLSFLEKKLEFELNDLINASSLEVGEQLKRKIPIRATNDMFKKLYENDKRGDFLITIKRTA